MVTTLSDEATRTAFSPEEFCSRNGISMATFWKLRDAGRAPKLMYLGRIIRISAEAERAWQIARENPTAKEAAEIARKRKMRQRMGRAAGLAAAASPLHVSKQGRRKR
jgi:predicted DNA-binding transcriptional regulator AlpA